jgi:D-3-phosphoglycerate dehydrogenase
MFRIQTMNKISDAGLELFPRDRYEVLSEVAHPDAVLVRSADMRGVEIPDSVKAIARAGAGYNNIPVAACSERGIVVFNTPGANANAVKELAIASLLISSRDIVGGINWGKSIADKGDQVAELVEKEKARFEGPEIKGKTLGVIGLGAIGVMVANDAMSLGMTVIGYDPFISVDAAWNLSRQVARAETLEGLLGKADYITLHLPLSEATTGILNAEKLGLLKKGARVINLARGALVRDADLLAALESGVVNRYVTDFPAAAMLAHPRVIGVPHLGASTPEAEENCAIMAAQQLKNFLESGDIQNSVNFPRSQLERRAPHRLLVINRNIPNMIGQITSILAGENINIMDLVNHYRDAYSYNMIDTAQKIPQVVMERLVSVEGIIRVRLVQ